MFDDKRMRDTIVWQLEKEEIRKHLKHIFEVQKLLYENYYKAQLIEMYGNNKKDWLIAMLLAIVDEYGEYERMDDYWEQVYELVDVLHFIAQMALIVGVSVNALMKALDKENHVRYPLRVVIAKWLDEEIDDRELVMKVWFDFLLRVPDLLAVVIRHHIKAKENERRQKEGY